MSRLKPIEKTCLQCNKTFLAKRSDAKFCGNVCRALYSNILNAKPGIIAEARISFAEEQRLKYDSVIVPKAYKKLVFELADFRGKDKVWIDRKFRLYQYFIVDDCHHGACEMDATREIYEELEHYKELALGKRKR